MGKRKIAAMLAATSAVGIVNSGVSVAFASERENEGSLSIQPRYGEFTSKGSVNLNFTKLVGKYHQITTNGSNTYIEDPDNPGKVLNVSGLVLVQSTLIGQKGLFIVENGYMIKNGVHAAEKYFNKWINAGGERYFLEPSNTSNKYIELSSGATTIDGKLYFFNTESWNENQRKLLKPSAGWINEGHSYHNYGLDTKYKYYAYSDYSFANKTVKINGQAQRFYDNGKYVGIPTMTLNVPETTTIEEGKPFDIKSQVYAVGYDYENLTDSVQVTLNGFNPDSPVPGTYNVQYKITCLGDTLTKTRKIIVNGLPKISGLTDVEIQSGEEFNPLTGVTVTDHEDKNITLDESNVTYTNDFNPKAPKVGTYVATYTVTDSHNYTTTGTRNITVTKRSDNGPTINGVEAKTIAKGVEFNPLDGVTATDIEDKAENIKLTVETPADFDVNNEGEYLFIYRAEDLDGNVTEVPRIITVEEMVDSSFVRADWSGETVIFEGKFDLLGRTDDSNVSKKLVIKDASNGVVLETDVTNLSDNENTGYRKTIGKAIFDQLNGAGKYNLFIKATIGQKEYELPITQNDIVNRAYVNNINDLAEKEFGTYKIKFMSDSSSNQVQIQKTNLADTEKPVITAQDISVERGDSSFDLKNGVTITDNVDSQDDLLARLEITQGNFDINQAGTYTVTYKVTDAAGNVSDTVTRTITVTAKTTTPPTITGADNISIVQGTNFDAKAGVTAKSSENEDLTSRIQVTGTINVNQVGEQTITYKVTDRDNNTTTVTRKVTVTAKPAANKLPTIYAPMRHEIYVGDNFDPLAIATAKDPEDGEITLTQSNIVFNKVNNQKPGEYTVKYEVFDSNGGRTSKVITVVVKERPVAPAKPTIEYAYNTIKTGSTFDPLDGVTVKDYKGNIIKLDKSNVAWNKVNTKVAGTYQVKYVVQDSEGNRQQFYRDVIVEGAPVTPPGTGIKPTIEYAYNTIQVGSTFDPLDGVTVKDYKGNIIKLDKSNVAWNKVNTKVAGTYQVKYVVQDSEGNRQQFYRDVIVKPDNATIQNGLKGNASLASITLDKYTDTLRVIGNVDKLTKVENYNETDVTTIASNVKYYLVAKDANGNEVFKNYMVRMNNSGSYSGFKTNLSLDELNKIQEGKDVTLSLVVETLGTTGELALDGTNISLGGELVDSARNVKYTTYLEGNKVKISKTKHTTTLNNSSVENVEVEANQDQSIEEVTEIEEVIEEDSIKENVVQEENTEEEVIQEENTAVEEVIEENKENISEEVEFEVISDKEILEIESELLLEGDLIIE